MGKLVEDYILEQEIGAGNFGKVYKAFNIKNSEIVAVKVISKEMLRKTYRLDECIQNEIEVLKLVQNKEHIINYHKSFKSSNNLYMVYEFCNGGTLSELLKIKKHLTEKQAFIIFNELLIAFKELNQYQIIHRDLKPENVFLHNGKIKLGDFGFSKALIGQSVTTTMIGSPIYMSPEVIKGKAYTSKSDIWSLGVILYEMIYGVCPFQSNSIAGLIMNLEHNNLRFPNNYYVSQKTIQLLKKMLEKNQFKRISWVQLFDYIETQQKSKSKTEFSKILRPFSQYSNKTNVSNDAEISIDYSVQQKVIKEKQGCSKTVGSSSTDSTFHRSNQSFSQELNLFSRFQLNRELNNLGNQLVQYCNKDQFNWNINKVLKTHKEKVQASNLAVDIFIEDQKDGSLYYYLILSQVKIELEKLQQDVKLDDLKQVNEIIKKQVKLIQKQLELVKQYLELKGIAVEDIYDCLTFLKMKQSSFSRRIHLWEKIVKYFQKSQRNIDDFGRQQKTLYTPYVSYT